MAAILIICAAIIILLIVLLIIKGRKSSRIEHKEDEKTQTKIGACKASDQKVVQKKRERPEPFSRRILICILKMLIVCIICPPAAPLKTCLRKQCVTQITNFYLIRKILVPVQILPSVFWKYVIF